MTTAKENTARISNKNTTESKHKKPEKRVPLKNIHWWKKELINLGLHPTGTLKMISVIVSRKIGTSGKTQRLSITFQNENHLMILVTGLGDDLHGDTPKQIEEVFIEFKNRLDKIRS